MANIIKTIHGRLLDWSGLANVPAALKALAGLKGRTGQIIEISGTGEDGTVSALTAVDKPAGSGATVPTKISAFENDAGYTTETRVQELLAAFPTFKIEVVQELPAAGAEKTIYLVPFADDSGSYLEYLYVNGAWEVVGNGQDSGENAKKREPEDGDKPRVYITGVKPTTKDNVLAELVYISKGQIIKAYIKIKCQGTSSMAYDKKNFTVTLYQDEARTIPLYLEFKDWGIKVNKFVLKANFIDHLHLFNILNANLWSQIVASRPDYDTLPAEMRNSPRHGAVDGFPIKLYYNGSYQGLYTWNIGKDAWQWGMDEDNPNHILLCAETNTDGTFRATPCNFRALWSGVDETDWSVEVGKNSDVLKNSLNNLIQFVMDNDGATFRAGIGQYLDIQAAIDYYIFQYEICGLDGLAKNMLLATYDGKLWRCGAYDMDSTWGLWWNGTKFVDATWRCPEDYQEQFSLLWERIEANYLSELKARQAVLRRTVLSYPNIVTTAERFTDTIGSELYAEDLKIYPGIPSGYTNTIQRFRNFVRDRQVYVDAEFAAMAEPVPATGITLSASTLTIVSKAPVTLTATVEPENTTDTVLWESTNTAVATVEGGVLTPIANGNTIIRAIAGNVSAECAVTVQYAEIPCTSISLDKTELTFDGSGQQTLTAAPVPADTTDDITWESSAPEIAAVENGVVTAVDNGSAVITVRCGEQSADCAVSVSGIVPNILRNVGWSSGYIRPETGEFEAADSDVCSDVFDISAYQGQLTKLRFGGALGGKSQRIAFYDVSGQFVSQVTAASDVLAAKVPDNASLARISMLKTNASVEITTIATEDIGWADLEATSGSVYDYDTGAIEVLSYCTIRTVPVTAGVEYLLSNVFGYVQLDAERQFIKGVPGDGRQYLLDTTADDVAYLGVNYGAANAHNVQRITNTTLIGTASDIVVS